MRESEVSWCICKEDSILWGEKKKKSEMDEMEIKKKWLRK